MITDERDGDEAEVEGDRNFAGIFGNSRRLLPSHAHIFKIVSESADDVRVRQTGEDQHQTENDTDNRRAAEFIHGRPADECG